MRKNLFPEMYLLERDYWWYRAKREYVVALVERFAKKKRDLKILDIGCGTGCLMEDLAKYGTTRGLDVSRQAIAYCRQRGLKNLYVGKIETSKFTSQKFDLVCAMDVIEHIKNDQAALTQIARILKPGGTFIMSTPAYPRLWSYWDEIAGHFRRYRRGELEEKVTKAGFSVLYFRLNNLVSFPAAVLVRAVRGKTIKNEATVSDFVRLPRILNSLLIFLLRLERQVAFLMPLPFGLSYFVVARKISETRQMGAKSG